MEGGGEIRGVDCNREEGKGGVEGAGGTKGRSGVRSIGIRRCRKKGV